MEDRELAGKEVGVRKERDRAGDRVLVRGDIHVSFFGY